MNKPKWVFRLESRSPENGLWYNAMGDPAWGIGENEHIYDTNAMLDSIDNSPTIVPAEGGGEDG